MKSATPLLVRTPRPGVAPSPPRRLESGFRLAAPTKREESSDSFLDGFGDELTPIDQVLPHLVAVTASRNDALDDDGPTVAMPVDVSAILSILAAKGLASPLGDVPASSPSPSRHPVTLLPPLAVGAEYARAPAPSIRVVDSAPPKLELEVVLVAIASFVVTLALGVSVAWALGAPFLRR